MNRHQFLGALHDRIRPRTYLETGVHKGQSMVLSRVPSIGIDPEFAIVTELSTTVQLARTTSDEFFAGAQPLEFFDEPVVDLAFIDGMHLSEYALRDYLAVERFTAPTSVLVFDDMLPRNILEANRRRKTGPWTGDVYKAAQALRDLRPDLIVLDVDTRETGTVVVLLPDASQDGVLPGYDDWLDVAMAPDPQDVPDSIINRTNALDPEKLVASAGWDALHSLRGRTDPGVRDELRDAFRDVLPG